MTGQERCQWLNDLLDAGKRHEEAAKAICEATKRAFPVGTRLAVTLGRARVIGRVTGVGDTWWIADPAEVFIENEETRKVRRFNPIYHADTLTVIDSPQAGDAVDPVEAEGRSNQAPRTTRV